MLPVADDDFVFLEMNQNYYCDVDCVSLITALLCVDKKAGYSDRHNNGSGKSRKYSFSNDATS